jgi:hypothetical protein
MFLVFEDLRLITPLTAKSRNLISVRARTLCTLLQWCCACVGRAGFVLIVQTYFCFPCVCFFTFTSDTCSPPTLLPPPPPHQLYTPTENMYSQTQVQQLLQHKQKEMSVAMDQYYRERMAELLRNQHAETAIDLARVTTERDQARQATTALSRQAEQGYQELYASIHKKHDAVISTLTEELNTSTAQVDALRAQ